MTIFIFSNNINTTLAGSVSPSATTITLASTANLPASIPAGQILVITLNDAATRQNYEVVYATARTGATLTVLRAQEGTAALAWLTGDYAFSGPTEGQQASFGQIGAANSWTGNNSWTGASTFNGLTSSPPISVGSGLTAGQAVNLGQLFEPVTLSNSGASTTGVTATTSFVAQQNGYVYVNGNAGCTSGVLTSFTLTGSGFTNQGGIANFGTTSVGAANFLLKVLSGATVTINLNATTSASTTINVGGTLLFLPTQ